MIAPPRPPSRDELEALIKEARERQMRRRLLGSAGVAIVAALGLSIYALVAGGSTTRTTDGSPRGTPQCGSSQLSATAELNGAAFGTMEGGAILTNTGGTACSLPSGRPRVHIVWHGRILPARETTEPAAGEPPPVRMLGPNSKAVIPMNWANWCGKPRQGAVSGFRPTFELRFADGLKIDAPGSVATPPLCISPKRPTSIVAVGRLSKAVGF
jgi:uncharacterized protein DUF4232